MAQNPDLPQKMMTMALHDRTSLYNSYMSFISTGGIFIPTEDAFEVGEEILLLLEVMEHADKFPLKVKVVWINPPHTNGGRPQGIGVAFPKGDVGAQAKSIIENNLAGLLDHPRPTYTL